VSRRGGTVRFSATRSATRSTRFVVGGRAVIAGGSRLPLWVAATHDGISFSSQVIAAGEVAQLFLAWSRGAPFFALCPAIGLHPEWWHRAPGTYLPDELLVGYIHALDLSPQLMTD